MHWGNLSLVLNAYMEDLERRRKRKGREVRQAAGQFGIRRLSQS